MQPFEDLARVFGVLDELEPFERGDDELQSAPAFVDQGRIEPGAWGGVKVGEQASAERGPWESDVRRVSEHRAKDGKQRRRC